MTAAISGLALAAGVSACNSSCATYLVTVTVEDQTSGDLLCDAKVTLFGSVDGGQVIDASAAAMDAEVPPSSVSCQWDTVVEGGTFQIEATAPGFRPGTATLTVSKDLCGSSTAPVTVILVRS